MLLSRANPIVGLNALSLFELPGVQFEQVTGRR
jgi:hypothetical protein